MGGAATRLWFLAAFLVVLGLASLLLGARAGIGPADLAGLLQNPASADPDQIVLRDMRLPRTIGALLAGLCLGAAGALIQTLTRNPLADPGLLGVNAGAAVGIVLAVWLAVPLPAGMAWLPALAGAFAVLAVIWLIGSVLPSPLTLILAGAAITAILSAALRGLILLDPWALDTYRTWIVGSFDQVTRDTVWRATPLALSGLGLGLVSARQLDIVSLGDDTARSLGADPTRTWLSTLVAIGLLTAASVLIAGPLAFVGLVAPHLARTFEAQTTRTFVLFAGCCGAGLVLSADILGRILIPGLVIEAGLLVTLIGGSFLIWTIRQMAERTR
ncbi:MAG: iron ABC transporter permease [Pseudomonadota bacterium]